MSLTDRVFFCLLLCAIVVAIMRFEAFYRSPRWALVGPWILLSIVTVSPFVPDFCLYLMSWRAEALIGHWPRPMRDDPANIHDPTGFYEVLNYTVAAALGLALGAPPVVIALLIKKRRAFSLWWILTISAVAILAWVLHSVIPSDRLSWWFD